MYKRGSDGKFKILVLLIIFTALIYGIFKIFTSALFESNPPSIALEDEIYWNLTSPLKFNVADDSGIKSLKIDLTDGEKIINLKDEVFNVAQKNLEISLDFPKNLLLGKNTNYSLNVKTNDISKWNFTFGNSAQKHSKIIVDTKKPVVNILNQSYKIIKGGAALVVFKAEDEILEDVYIQTNYGKIFHPTVFIKDGYYASLVAWPANLDEFRAQVVAKDKAGNVTNSQIRYFYQDKKYKISNIKLTQNFIDGKVSELASIYSNENLQGLEKFKFVNETLRKSNSEAIYAFSSKIHEDKIDEFFINPFYPLKKGAAVASYGDHRIYMHENEKVSESWHLGIDLASVANADITETNYGVVVYVEENGIYGLNVGIYYGFGLYGIYGHCASSNLKVGDQIKPGDVIAKTGATGFAFGDHLHFGLLVQGIEVRPEEWMDSKWMKDNIYDVMQNSKKVILGNK